MNNSNNIVNLADYEKEKEILAYLNLLRIGKLIEVINIDENGVVDVYEFGINRLGLEFGYDFVTFEEKPQIYPINLDMGNDEYYCDDEPGIYVSGFEKIPDSKRNEYYTLVENNLDSFRKIEKMYFDKFLKDKDIEYSKDSKKLYRDDKKYYKNKECEIIDFTTASKIVKSIEREKNKEYIKNLVKGHKR